MQVKQHVRATPHTAAVHDWAWRLGEPKGQERQAPGVGDFRNHLKTALEGGDDNKYGENLGLYCEVLMERPWELSQKNHHHSGLWKPFRYAGEVIPVVAAAAAAARRASGLNSVALVALEPDEPVETVTVDDLPVGCAPRPRLQVVHDPATFAETGKPVAQYRRSGGTKKGQHHAFASE